MMTKKQLAEVWEKFPGYMIDNCEGLIVTEENLQQWLSDMLSEMGYT